MAPEITPNGKGIFKERIRDMKVLQHPHTANHNQLKRS
jgi:hypothetical protein